MQDYRFANHQILIFVTSILLMIALQLIVKKTKIGKAMRAVSTDPDAAALMGINVNNTISFTFALGSALAGAAGVMIGMYYNSIDPLMGMIPGLKAFIAAVFGGIGIIPGRYAWWRSYRYLGNLGKWLWFLDDKRCRCIFDSNCHFNHQTKWFVR